MPAPLVSALNYLLAPRAIGTAADSAIQARMDALVPKFQALGMSQQEIQDGLAADPFLNFLASLPRRSGVESTIESLGNLYRANTAVPGPVEASPDARTIDEILAGRGFNDPSVQAQPYVERNGQFLTPMDDFLRYGGRDDDAGGRYYMAPSYGQTDQPATEVRFDQPPGGAHGGIAALIRSQYAKR